MKIIVVHQYAVPDSRPGANRCFGLSRELVRLGHEVVVVSAAFNHFGGGTVIVDAHAPVLENHDGVHFLWIPVPSHEGNSVRRIFNLLAFAWRVSRLSRHPVLYGANIVLGSSPYPSCALAAAYLAQRMHVPFALEVRDLWPETLVALKGLSRANPVVVALRAVEWLLYRQARRIVTPLGGSERYFALKNVEPERVVWIPNGVDFNLLPQDRTSPKGAFKIYYAGAIGAPNAVDTLLDVAERVLRAKGPDEVQFHFLGEGTQKSALVQRAHKQCLTNVVFHQGVAKSEVFAKLQDAHAFIVTLRQSYLYEFGIGLNKLYDYLAMGRPVILGCPPVPEPVSLSGAGIRTPLKMSAPSPTRFFPFCRCRRPRYSRWENAGEPTSGHTTISAFWHGGWRKHWKASAASRRRAWALARLLDCPRMLIDSHRSRAR